MTCSVRHTQGCFSAAHLSEQGVKCGLSAYADRIITCRLKDCTQGMMGEWMDHRPPKVPWYRGATVPQGIMVPRYHVTWLPQNHWVPWYHWVPAAGYHSTWVPGYLGTWVPQHLGNIVLGYHGTRVLQVSGYHSTWIPWYHCLATSAPRYHGAFNLGTMVLDQNVLSLSMLRDRKHWGTYSCI